MHNELKYRPQREKVIIPVDKNNINNGVGMRIFNKKINGPQEN